MRARPPNRFVPGRRRSNGNWLPTVPAMAPVLDRRVLELRACLQLKAALLFACHPAPFRVPLKRLKMRFAQCLFW